MPRTALHADVMRFSPHGRGRRSRSVGDRADHRLGGGARDRPAAIVRGVGDLGGEDHRAAIVAALREQLCGRVAERAGPLSSISRNRTSASVAALVGGATTSAVTALRYAW